MFDFLIYPLIFRTPPHNPGQHPRQDPGQGVGFNSSIELFFFFYLKQAMRPARICAQAAALVPCCALKFFFLHSPCQPRSLVSVASTCEATCQSGNIRLSHLVSRLVSPARLDIVIGNNIDDYNCLEIPTATWRCLFHRSHTLGVNCLLISLNTPT